MMTCTFKSYITPVQHPSALESFFQGIADDISGIGPENIINVSTQTASYGMSGQQVVVIIW